jgi:hypothetical protein
VEALAPDEAELMFERAMERARLLASGRAEARVLELTERMRACLPRGIAAEAGAGGVRLKGRNLRRRFAIEPALRWMQFK